jgi:hypothetical protein
MEINVMLWMTYPKYGRVIMDTPERCGLIDREIFYFWGTEDDILVWFLNGWNELRWRPIMWWNASDSHLWSVKVKKREPMRPAFSYMPQYGIEVQELGGYDIPTHFGSHRVD